MAATLEHPDLGRIIGREARDFVEYRGLQYATLEDKFATAQLFTNPERKTLNATATG